MHDIKQLELHVTHACNFTCEGCSHYSNHGHFGNISLDDIEDWLYAWSERIRPKTLTILGGEPTLNKDLPEIVYMVRAIYPDPFTHIDVISNTTGLTFSAFSADAASFTTLSLTLMIKTDEGT